MSLSGGILCLCLGVGVRVCLYICLVMHFVGKPIRHSEQAQRYMLLGKHFIGYTFLSIISNYHTNIVCVLLAVDLKQAVIHVISNYTL